MQTVVLTTSPGEAKRIETTYRVVRRSLDARQRNIKVNLTILADDAGHYIPIDAPLPRYEEPHFQHVESDAPVAYIIGAGPAGLFAALTLLEHGIKPIIFERGKTVSERKKDIALLNRNIAFNPESNYCFGEGGAGTFSDGKLFSRSKKRGNMQRVMELFHFFGAPDNVLYEAHAHIGSDKLPRIIQNMRECILAHGGEIHFQTLITSLSSIDSRLSTPTPPVILAIGHSAHDTYRMLAREGIAMQTKGFALGVRVEHPQSLINRLFYHNAPAQVIALLGNASYSLVTQVNSRGVYSFCMCPGGHIVPAGSAANGCVVNGMSASHRNSPFANSGMVVQINPDDIGGSDPLRGLDYQETYEALAYTAVGNTRANGAYSAPAQRLQDFVNARFSQNLPPSSYLPGLISSRLDEWLPEPIGSSLRQGLRIFDRKYPGFLTNEAVVVGVESRSSSPVRILRDNSTLTSISHPWLYPCGEGAGYAGGITSSALDGINAAHKIAIRYGILL